ncbi:toll/interleukin-1 receptor domain-containing protein [Aequorivita lipolytica]|uniref:Toll/interleukin-1 receptor domain-containing protein n=1 Tax=Aequorivita lipolytica TaxID=153267 RepID=A0A5C6YME5_9FLAO|nr:toll/interleukin-1 receptor domain-containing protein [Aequorivita lipolytica]TXD68439.1 toll/interleukin-1 receptor domain-containing protein [Aequorivita lipolytica]SRX51415.1 hypothetical protein AEQU2_01898 [Aequorivita lipolytica]
MAEGTIFFSYSRDDSEFVLSLAKSLREAGAKVWLDQLDIKPGNRWDNSIENALKTSHTLLVVLSKSSVKSNNVLDEVSYALEENKKVVPVLLEECKIPFRLRRLQYATFAEGHKKGIDSLVSALQLDDTVANRLADVAELPILPKPKPIPPTPDPILDPIEQDLPNYYKPKKTSNAWMYILSGLAVLAVLAVVLILSTSGDTDKELHIPDEQYNNQIVNTNDNPTNTESAIAQDWAYATNTNNIEGYVQFVRTHGKNNTYYNDAYTRMKNMFSENGYVKYGIVNVEQYFNKTLYFDGNELTIPVQGDFISPKMENEIWKNNSPTGYYVQPGRFYLVMDVATDANNVVWVHLAI